MAISSSSKLSEIVADPRACAIIDSYIPGFITNPEMGPVMGMKFKTLVKFPQVPITREQAKELLAKIDALGDDPNAPVPGAVPAAEAPKAEAPKAEEPKAAPRVEETSAPKAAEQPAGESHEHADIKMSTATKSRKNLRYLQRMKDKGEKIVQMCPAELSPLFALAAEMVDCDIARITSMLAMRCGNRLEDELTCGTLTVQKYREYTKVIHLNFYMPTATYATKENAVRWGAQWVFFGADSMLPMGITNDVLKHMTDNYVPVYGHIGAVSGWQSNAYGYRKVGKTAEDAFRIFKWGYEYQENGMGGMTIELTPMEVSQKISEKLRVPVVSIAGGAPCDGSEMVDMDTFGVMPKPASHSKTYAQLLPFLCDAYAAWADDVREGNYPEEKHGYHMDPTELEKFTEMVDKFEA